VTPPVAICGIGAILPGAPDAAAFWDNIAAGHYAISDVDPARWDPALYYDADPRAPERTYSKIGGWVRDWEWDPFGWGLPIPPKVADGMDDAQKWALACSRMALLDAGWPERPLDLERTAVVLGNAMSGEKHYLTSLRVMFPELARELERSPSFGALEPEVRAAIERELRGRFEHWLPSVTEDTMPGELGNCMAGRVANLFNLHGPNYVVDAACASAMAAMEASIDGLIEHEYDAVLTGGIDRNMGASSFIKFCAIGALSATGTRPYADGADGFVMGEGGVVFLLKRLQDAEAAGDRIYAVVRGIAGASDGRGKGITAPNPAGQRLAVERAWARAGLSPAECSMIEGHGTSTRVGDVVELEALAAAFGASDLAPGSIALGSVKSNIGHLKAAAGAAGMLKTALSLHHRQLPPSLNFERPNPNVDWTASPFRVNTELREWSNGGVRVAGVSAFGFGGTNFHAVLEEYVPGRHAAAERTSFAVTADVPAARTGAGAAPAAAPRAPLRGLLVLGAPDVTALERALRAAVDAASAGEAPTPAAPSPEALTARERIAIDFEDAADLAVKGAQALKAFGAPAMWVPLRARGVFRGSGPPGKIAFLFTGQGSQYPNMLRTLRAREPIVRDVFDRADAVMRPLLGGRALTDVIFVDPDDEAAVAAATAELMRTEITQPAVLAVDHAIQQLLAAYGIEPDLVIGHSLGEYGALVAAGALSFEEALEAVSARGHEMAALSVADNGAMAAVGATLEEVEQVLASVDGYAVVANVNSTSQLVIGGATAPVEEAVRILTERGRTAVRIPVSHAFHTQIVAPASEPLRATLRRLHLRPARIPVIANVDARPYPDGDIDAMIDILGRQVAAPVQFVDGLRTLRSLGARTFVECGPKRALQTFAADVLGEDAMCLNTNHPKQGDVMSFNQGLAGLYAAGHGAPAPATPAVDDEPVVITGASLGLPGTERMFDDTNVARILDGEQLIDVIPSRLRHELLERHITRLVKGDDGSAGFEEIDDVANVIKLAARGGDFDLHAEFAVDADRIPALGRDTQLAIAAGLDALRDAGIPLVARYRTTTKGTRLPVGWALPAELRDDTGVIFASAFPGLEELATDLDRYWADRARREQLAALESLRERAGSGPLAAELEHRMHELRAQIDAHPFEFDRRFLFRILSMGHSQFAELIGARGPNTQVNAACASTTQAVALAEDWIRAGRCSRVIVIAADDATSDELLPWVGGGFLASGAAATDEDVEHAALPFDQRRHGMLLGMGAAALVVESAGAARDRGLTPICEVLGAATANSAFHGTRLDVEHIGDVMEGLVAQAERRGYDRAADAASTLFVSHETYTPARGGSASAEIHALRAVFHDRAGDVLITNTKGFTGHPMGVGIEDVVAVKALETGIVPPVPNFREPDPELGELNLSKGGAHPIRYALRLAAGFGSQVSMLLLRWCPAADERRRHPDELGFDYRVADRATWRAWLVRVSGEDEPRLEVDHRRLRVADPRAAALDGPPSVPAQPVTAPVTAEQVSGGGGPVAAASPVAAEPAGSVGLSADVVLGRVLEIVGSETGYPADMLDPELDLEADLGIDTVKQAEVFAAIREEYGIERDDALKLRDYPTLNHVVAFVLERAGGGGPVAAASPVAAEPVPEDQHFPRRVPVPVLRPALELCAATSARLGRVLVVDDEGGAGAQLRALLAEHGAEIVTSGPVDGVYWLAALDPDDLSDVAAALGARVKRLAETMRGVAPEAFLIAATRLGGMHGYGPSGPASVLGGAVTGFTKALAREREGAVIKAVDFEADADPATIARTLIDETLRDPAVVEVGHAGDLRWAVGLAERHAEPGTPLSPDMTFLITGAAGSIVSAITADLAAAAGGGTFHLLDLAPAPDPTDPDIAAFRADKDGLKRAIADRIRAAGERPTPKLVERELGRLERACAAQDAIAAVERAGAAAIWHQVDLTDAAAVAAACPTGRVDVLLHCAGLEISHFLPDKPQAEYDLVFDVKALGWFHVLEALDEIGSAVVFSSIAGRFGNAGQTDYAAANDLLCKSVASLRARGVRGIAIDWTAWAQIGMASRGSIPKMMALAGIDMLPPDVGIPVVRRELTAAGDGSEVLVAGSLGLLLAEADEAGGLDVARTAALAEAGPMTGRIAGMTVYGGLRIESELDPSRQPFLDHHRIEGIAVLPGVMGIEAFAEAAAVMLPGFTVTALEDVELRAPFKFYRDEPRSFEVRAVLTGDPGGVVAECALSGRRTLATGEEQETVHFTGRVVLDPVAPTAAPAPHEPHPPGAGGVGHDDVYRVYFHGPAYQVLERAWRVNGDVVGRLADGLPADNEPPTRPLAVDPRLIELCFQTAGIYELGTAGRMALPTHIDRVLRFDGDGGDGPLYAVVTPHADGSSDADVVDEAGHVRLRLEGYRTTRLPGEIDEGVLAPIRAAMA